MEATKRCSKCKEIKQLSKFTKDLRHKDGLQSSCKSCHNFYVAKYQKTPKGKIVNRKGTKKYLKTSKGKLANHKQHKRYYDTKRGYLNYVFGNMLIRCNNPKSKAYKNYGGRGIKVKFLSFDDFYNYIVNELKADPRGLSIDRIDNDGNYERGNIRFVNQAENNRNKRKTA